MYQYAAFPVPDAVDFDDPRVASYQTRWDEPAVDKSVDTVHITALGVA